MKKAFIHTLPIVACMFVCLFVINTSIHAQERFSLIFSEQSYFFNPALASISGENRYSFGFSNQGYGQTSISSLHAHLNYFSKDLNGGFEGYAVRYKEGAMAHNLISFQLSRFTHIYKNWSLSLGIAPDIHNYTVSSDIVLESQLLNYQGTDAVFPSIWGIGLSCGIALFSKEHSIGFSVQNIFEKTYFKNSSNNPKNPSQINYIFSLGSIFDLKPYKNHTSKTFLRPHFVSIINNSEAVFFYGTFYGSHKKQFGMFFVSSPNYMFLGLSPAFMARFRNLKILFSLNYFPHLSSLYSFGNEFIVQGFW